MLERIGFVSTTVLVAAVMALVALGPFEAPRLALADLQALARGVVGPFSSARVTLDGALAHLHAEGAVSTAARFTSVILAGQVFAVQNLQFLRRDQSSTRAKRASKLAFVLMLAMFAIALAWLLACLVWLVR